MSTSHVLADTLALAQASNLGVCLLPTWYDIDTIDDLLRLDGEINGSSMNGSAPATRRWLSRTDWRNSQA
jgi:hypothetical protein